MTLLTDGDEIIAKVQAPRVEEVEEVPAEAGEGVRGRGSRRGRRLPRARLPATDVRRGLRFGRRRPSRQRERRPDANTIGKRIVICSGDSAPSRSRSVATRRSRTSRFELGEEGLLVELGQERDVVVDA